MSSHTCCRVIVTAALAFGAARGAAQIPLGTPAITFNGDRPAAVHESPAEAYMNIAFESGRTWEYAVPATQAHYPKDSVMAVVSQRAQDWIKALQASPVHGLELDPYGIVSIVANQDSLAQRSVAERLATPGLPFMDQAYTLQMAASGFADANKPERLPTSERYVAQLDALGDKAALWQFAARQSLILAYYRLGRTQDVVRVGTRAFALVSKIPFEWRGTVFSPGFGVFYTPVVDAMSGQPHGRDSIRVMNEALLAATTPPPALLAHDSSFAWDGQSARALVQSNVDATNHLGLPGKPIIANYWANRGATRDSQTVAVNDGKIRVIEIGGFTCEPCLAAMPGMERLHKKYPGVEFNFLTAGTGVWGNRVVPVKEEASHLADHFLNNFHVTFPIGILMPVWVPNPEGGQMAVLQIPTFDTDHYPQTAKPSFFILDGKGIIRHMIGGYNRDFEDTIARTIEYLQHEAPQS